jgi:hypothetical protein
MKRRNQPIISVTLNPCRANDAVCDARSCCGSGTVAGPADSASMRPARNGMLGPPQFFIARITLHKIMLERGKIIIDEEAGYIP